jgi:hypothetical protein
MLPYFQVNFLHSNFIAPAFSNTAMNIAVSEQKAHHI